MNAGRLALAAVAGSLVLAAAATSAPSIAANSVFRVRPDLRMCPSPMCGGFFVSRVNRATTTCADGTVRAWCYVAGIDHAAPVRIRTQGAGRDGTFLLRGRIVRGTAESRSLGRLIATAEWIAATPAPWSGTVYLVIDTGVRCIRAPCFSLRTATVNTTRTASASGLELSIVAAPPAIVRKAQTALTTGGLLVAGTTRRDADGGRTVVAAQFFFAAG